jgi:hypothetical protein
MIYGQFKVAFELVANETAIEVSEDAALRRSLLHARKSFARVIHKGVRCGSFDKTRVLLMLTENLSSR